MDKKINVLVTGIGCCGTGEGVVKALKLAKKYRIVGTDIHSLSAMSFRVDAGYKVPIATDSKYIDKINDICEKENIDVLIPASDWEMDAIANNVEKINDNVFVLAHSKELVNTCRDAWETYLFLKENKFATPESYIPSEPKELDFPLFIKDRFGGGSKNAFKVNTQEELDYYLEYFKKKNLKPIIQEYIGIPEEEYTVGVFVSKENAVIYSLALKTKRLAGASYMTIKKDFDDIRAEAEKVALALKPMGSVNVQIKPSNGKNYTFEVNPRFSGSTPIRVGLGINEVDMAIRHFYLGEKLDKITLTKDMAIMRCFQEVYVDLEDVGKLNKGEKVSHKGKIHDYV